MTCYLPEPFEAGDAERRGVNVQSGLENVNAAPGCLVQLYLVVTLVSHCRYGEEQDAGPAD